MNVYALLATVIFEAAMAAIAPDLGWMAQLVLLGLLVVMQGTGLLIGHVLCQRMDPFLALILGFVVLSHAMLAADIIVPGAHPVVAAAFALPAAGGFLLTRRPANGAATFGLAVLASLFTFGWSADIEPRVRRFHATGKFAFWLDGLIHTGNLAQFAMPAEIGRGMVLMADMPRPLYHYASMMPAALLPALTGVTPLDATLLAWLPLGIVFMVCGVVTLGLTLGLTLGGPGVAATAVIALAAIPDPGRFRWGNGWLGFDWVLEMGPGTAYSLGVACASLAMLVRWTRDQRSTSLLLAIALAMGCVLVRVNTFMWLAPTVVLGILAGWRRISVRSRWILTGLGLLGLVILLVALSWRALWAHPGTFLFGYIDFVHLQNLPTDFPNFYPALRPRIGRVGAGLVGLGLTLLETAGWWLPGFLILGFVLRRRGRLEIADYIPCLLFVVAALEMLLAPVARNGDMSEYRHRAGPLLVVALLVWTVRFICILAGPILERLPPIRQRVGMGVAAVLSLIVLYTTISAAKRPRMAWGRDYYDLSVPPDLMALAPLLAGGTDPRPRFVVAHQPADSRVIDDAARLVALSGVPAYVSCPSFLVTTGGVLGEEAERRLAVVARLDQAPDLEALRAIMRSEHITGYVTTTSRDAPFDPTRSKAAGHFGVYAVYSATP